MVVANLATSTVLPEDIACSISQLCWGQNCHAIGVTSPIGDLHFPTETAVSAFGWRHDWPGVFASYQTRRARPSSNNALSATLSNSNLHVRRALFNVHCQKSRALSSAQWCPREPPAHSFSNLTIFRVASPLARCSETSSPTRIPCSSRQKNLRTASTADPACCGRNFGLLKSPSLSALVHGFVDAVGNAPRPDRRCHFSDRGPQMPLLRPWLGHRTTCNQPSETSTLVLPDHHVTSSHNQMSDLLFFHQQRQVRTEIELKLIVFVGTKFKLPFFNWHGLWHF